MTWPPRSVPTVRSAATPSPPPATANCSRPWPDSNDTVNGWFICDRGRFANSAVNDPARPRHPLADGRKVEWDDALEKLLHSIREFQQAHGPRSLAIVGSSRLSMEAATLLHRLYTSVAAGSLCYFVDAREADRATCATTHLTATSTASMADVQKADLIAILDCDLLAQGPMMALAIRQAWRQGATVYLVRKKGAPSEDPGKLPFPWQSAASLSAVPLEKAKQPVIVCDGSKAAAKELPRAVKQQAKLAFLLGGPNGFGAALLAAEHGITSLSGEIAKDRVRGIIAVEADIPAGLLQEVSCIAALDWRATEAVAAARIVLPTTAWVEMDGTYVNNEGRAQRFKKVMNPGLPIKGLDPALHPPRHHTDTIPGGDLRPAWKIVQDIIERLGAEKDTEPLSGKWEKLREIDAESDGLRVFSK